MTAWSRSHDGPPLQLRGSVRAVPETQIALFRRAVIAVNGAASDRRIVRLAAELAQTSRAQLIAVHVVEVDWSLPLDAEIAGHSDEAQQVLVRLQRSLSSALFNHEGKDVFVTFSAGVTLYRPGETLEAALDRADVALYEAKHTGKNRACIAE